MNKRPKYKKLPRILLASVGIWMGGAVSVSAQAPLAKFKSGDILVVVQPGTQPAGLDALKTKVGADTVQYVGFTDIYLLTLPGVRKTDPETLNAVAALKNDPNVRWVGTNDYPVKKQAPKTNPNDPRFTNGDQWGPRIIRLPEAWTLWKGAIGVNVADIDDGFSPGHEDMVGRYDKGSMNFEVTPPDGNLLAGNHGSHTSSIMVANTNNSIGMAGVLWQGNCIALKTLNGPESATLAAYDYLHQDKIGMNKLKVVAVNMSYGFPRDSTVTSDPEFIATKMLDTDGIICMGAGAEQGGPAQMSNVPNGYPHVINTIAGDRNGGLSSFNLIGVDPYGTKPRVDLVGPGGDGSGTSGDVLGVSDNASAYDFEAGTSFACPYACGVVTLLRSVPGVTKAQAVNALLKGANKTGLTTVPDPSFGYGYLDAYGSLAMVTVSATIVDPVGLDANNNSTDPSGLTPPPIETLKPTLRFRITNVSPDNVSITIDPGTADAMTFDNSNGFITAHIESGNVTGSNPQYVIAFRVQFKNMPPFMHRVVLTATNPVFNTSTTDIRTFSIQPHTLPSSQTDLNMISIPYFEDSVDAGLPAGKTRDVGDLLGTSVVLYRWLNGPVKAADGTTVNQGGYAAFGAGATDPDASLHPINFKPTPDNSTLPADTTPLGVGYFLKSNGPIQVVTNGQSFDTSSFRIPLHEGWNMVGNPYRFAIPFEGLEFQDLSGTRLTAEQAADKKLILPFLYRRVGGQYQFERLPAGNMQAWEAQWMYVIPQNAASLRTDTVLTMITTPVPVSGFSGRSAKALRSAAARTGTASLIRAPKVSGDGNWAVQLEASSRNLHDGYNFVGVTRSAVESSNSLVPKPPQPSPYVSLGITHKDGNGAVYAQYLQQAGGVKTWDVVVTTDQANTDITLRWPNISTLPKNYRLTLQDKTTGQEVDLRHQASYLFNSGHEAGTRAFVLTAHPTNSGGRAVLTNIFVNPPRTVGGRAAGAYEIGYTVSQDVRVEVAVMGYNGQTLSQVGATRAISSGDNHLTWNGRDAKGAVVPAGTYLLQLKAITTDGAVTREIRPLTITGR